MQRGISLTDLAAKIEAQRNDKRDIVASTASLRISVNPETNQPVMEAPSFDKTLPVLPVAMQQIATHTKVPVAYIDRMAKDAPELLATNINHWFQANPSRRMVRTIGGRNRAFLSDRYQRIENEEIAEQALPVLMTVPGIEIVSCEATDRRLYIEAVTSRIKGEVKVGDEVQAGVLITNSEVGLGSISVSAIVWRLICLNGAKMPDGGYRRNHVGRRVDDDLEQVWADDTRRADDMAILLKVRDMTKAALDEVQFKRRIDRMRTLADPSARITGDPSKAVEVLAKKVGATENERGGILRALIEGGDLTAWGLTNAVTAQAHSGSYDRAQEFQAIGGDLIELPANQWKEILQAAA